MARTKAYDPDQVLDKAMQLFWEQGYAATSVSDLEQRLGINRFSLYSTFGNKRKLFLAALDRYEQGVTAPLLEQLADSAGGLATVHRFFDFLAGRLADRPRQFGCLLINSGTELSAHDAEISHRVQRTYRGLEDGLYACLATAQQRGELGPAVDLPAYARFLLTLSQGLITVAKAEQDVRTVESAVRHLHALLPQPSA